MRGILKKALRALLPLRRYETLPGSPPRCVPKYARVAYGNEGEDLVLASLLADRPNGFYVDVGSFHPILHSNTWLLYQRGWRGINVDPLPASAGLFRALRPGDVFVPAAVAEALGEITFYVFDREPTLSTCAEAAAVQRAKSRGCTYAATRVPALPLAALLEQHLPPGRAIDLLNVDVEGSELEVLRSNDWQRFRPECVLVECLGATFEDLADTGPYRFLHERDYLALAKTGQTVFFCAKGSPLVEAYRAQRVRGE